MNSSLFKPWRWRSWLPRRNSFRLDGGLGYHDVIRSGYAAYVAAIFQSSAALCRIDPQIFESGIPLISAFNELSGLPNSLTFNDIVTLNASSVDFSTNKNSLQSKIYNLQRNHERDSLVDSINDLNQIAVMLPYICICSYVHIHM